jgi:hypothetical protein
MAVLVVVLRAPVMLRISGGNDGVTSLGVVAVVEAVVVVEVAQVYL